jgi:hypothetical protein
MADGIDAPVKAVKAADANAVGDDLAFNPAVRSCRRATTPCWRSASLAIT